MSRAMHSRQGGTALVVSLIILAVVTLLGVSSMSSSNTELKLVSTQRDRSVAFEAAEAALAMLERDISQNPPAIARLYSNCVVENCFNSTCTGGFCFAGDYQVDYSQYQCQVADPTGTHKRVEFWSDEQLNVWKNTARHRTIHVDNLATEVKYIVEFLCYVPSSPDVIFDESESGKNNGAPLFRFTVLAEGNGERASVALQSTYKVKGH